MSTLKEILTQLAALDAEDEFIDPGQIIGDLNGKVDGIKAKIDEWDAEIERLNHWENQISARRRVYANAIERLTNYVQFQMTQHGYEKLPGEIWEIKWRKNPPRVDVHVPADANQFLRHRAFVKQETSYKWDKNKLKEALKAGQTFDFAELVQESKITFGVKKK